MSVWLSTTLISALREMIELYTFYFSVMQAYLDGLLDILVACICQGEPTLAPVFLEAMTDVRTVENDTLARIGTSCFQQLLENNVRKLSPEKWDSIVSAFVQLFRTTTASQLFEPVLHAEVQPTELPDEDGEAPIPLPTSCI
jgi:brefeldin A-inhibited guanine nucleotide-exchange protein